MKGRTRIIAGLTLLFFTGCTNILYQGELTTQDAYGKERQFILYWTSTEPLIGEAKAGPAVLLTECSLTRIDFTDQSEGVVFRGTAGEDRLAGRTDAVEINQICGVIEGISSLREAKSGTIDVRIDCEPMPPDDFAAYPRNYLAASPPKHRFTIVETERSWSILGQTLPGPAPIDCRED